MITRTHKHEKSSKLPRLADSDEILDKSDFEFTFSLVNLNLKYALQAKLSLKKSPYLNLVL
jgi:hypothetical protein